MEICSVCLKGVQGGFEVYERTRKDGTPLIVIDTTPDRNYNVCDMCNEIVCFACSEEPESGYCNRCLHRARERVEE
jgi:hypothetical protein